MLNVHFQAIALNISEECYVIGDKIILVCLGYYTKNLEKWKKKEKIIYEKVFACLVEDNIGK